MATGEDGEGGESLVLGTGEGGEITGAGCAERLKPGDFTVV